MNEIRTRRMKVVILSQMKISLDGGGLASARATADLVEVIQ